MADETENQTRNNQAKTTGGNTVQSGQSIRQIEYESTKPESKQENNADRIDSRRKDQGR